MQFRITEETHNRVAWEMYTPLVRLEIGLGVGLLLWIIVVVVLPGFTGFGWLVMAVLLASILGAALYLALSTPLVEQGVMERLPDGGGIRRVQRWLIGGDREAMSLPLENVEGYTVEVRTFTGMGGELRRLARLRVLPRGEADALPLWLTDWLEPEAAETFSWALAQASRRPVQA